MNRRNWSMAAGLLVAAMVLAPATAASAAPGYTRTMTSGSAGTDIGNAASITGTVTGTIISGSDDWWVVYPAAKGGAVDFTVTNYAASGSSCTGINASLDGTGGTNQQITSVGVGAGEAGQLTGKAAGSDRYYVEVTPSVCASDTPYQVTLNSGGGGTAPAPAAGSVAAGFSIAGAWPPLRGDTSYAETLGSTANPDWYVLFKKPDSNPATVRVEDTGTGCGLNVYLYDTNGTQDNPLQVAQPIDTNGSATFIVPPAEPGDSHGRYFLAVSGNYCGGGGEPYSIEPEPSAEFTSPAAVTTASITAGTSIGDAGPALQGALVYHHALGSTARPDWYVLFKKPDSNPATVRVENTGTGCGLNVYLYDTNGTQDNAVQIAQPINSDGSVTFTVPPKEPGDSQGRYFLAVSGNYCGGGGEAYSIEPEPSAEFTSPAAITTVAMPSGSTMKAAGGPLKGGVRYTGSLGHATSQDWVYLHATGGTPVTVRVEDTTQDRDNCQSIIVTLYNSAGTALATTTLGDNGAVGLVVSDPAAYYLQLTVAGGCAPVAPLTADMTITPASGVFGPALFVSDTTLKNAVAGTAYSAPIAVTGGTQPYTFAAESSLPIGLSLNKTTGVISGTPTQKGTFTFQVKITDTATPTAHTVTDRFTITIS